MQKSLELAGQSTNEEVAGQEGCQKFILGVPLASWPTQDKAQRTHLMGMRSEERHQRSLMLRDFGVPAKQREETAW